MRMNHHLSEATLVAYRSGGLVEALKVVAASHIAWCSLCQGAASRSASSGDRPADDDRPALPAASAKRDQTAIKARRRPAPPANLAGFDPAELGLPLPLVPLLGGLSLGEIAWRNRAPGIAVHRFSIPAASGGRLALVRFAPGRGLPEHGHGGRELTLVLRGTFKDGNGRFSVGDCVDLDQTVVHRPAAEPPEPCICLMAAEAPARFTTLWGRLMQPLVGV